jgi:hypothetical protein
MAVNARMRFVVFGPKMSPNGRRFKSPSGQITISPIKYTRTEIFAECSKINCNCHRKRVRLFTLIIRLKNLDSTLSIEHEPQLYVVNFGN